MNVLEWCHINYIYLLKYENILTNVKPLQSLRAKLFLILTMVTFFCIKYKSEQEML